MYFTSKPFRIVKQNSKYLNWKINFDSRFFFFIEYVILLDLTPLLLTNCAVYIYISIFETNSQRRFFERREYRTVEIYLFFVRRARVIHPTLLFLFFFLLFCSRFFPSSLPSHLFFNVDASFFFFLFFFFSRKNSSTKMFDLFAPSLLKLFQYPRNFPLVPTSFRANRNHFVLSIILSLDVACRVCTYMTRSPWRQSITFPSVNLQRRFFLFPIGNSIYF